MKTNHLLLMLIGLCLAVSAHSQKCPEIRQDHPRIFFNSDTWPAIKERAYSENKAYLDKLLAWADKMPENPVAGDVEMPEIEDRTIPIKGITEFGTEAAACALAWHFTGNEKYLDKAKKMLKVSADAYTQATLNGRPVHWYSHSRINAFCAYDWLYNELTPEERASIIVPLMEHVEMAQPEYGLNIPRTNQGSISTGFYGVRTMFWYSGLAAYGDGINDDLAQKHLEKGYDLNMKMLDFRNKNAGDDGGLSSAVPAYSTVHYRYAHFNFLFTMLSSTGQDIAPQYPAMPLYANWLWWIWIRDEEYPKALRHAGFGDSHHNTDEVSTESMYEHLSQTLHFYKDLDPDAYGMILAMREFSSNRRIEMGTYPVLPFLINVNQAEADSKYLDIINNSPLKSRHFETLGQFYMRSAFAPGATYCTFTAGATLKQHKHHDENNFTIYKHDHLAMESGDRATQRDYNLVYYYSQSVAHNVVLIHKPDEPFPTYWGMKRKDHKKVKNYGGMTSVSGSVVKAYETNDKYTYVASDATACYGDKCKEAVRQFVFLYPDYVIVYDRVESSDPSYKKEWLLHMQNEPTVKGNLLTADARDGRMFCQTLLPADAQFNVVGGKPGDFFVGEENYPLIASYVKEWTKKAEKSKRGPYWGGWRLEVSPSKANAEDRFLHVITAASVERTRPVNAKLVKDGDRDGVSMKVDGHKVTFWFNRNGEIGGEVEYDGKVQKLTDQVQKQTGFEY